jgi:uncharacterized membrane protein SirB2
MLVWFGNKRAPWLDYLVLALVSHIVMAHHELDLIRPRQRLKTKIACAFPLILGRDSLVSH